jgi:hypothetical protein
MECLYLLRNGVPFDIAFSMSDLDRWHFSYALQQLDQILSAMPDRSTLS